MALNFTQFLISNKRSDNMKTISIKKPTYIDLGANISWMTAEKASEGTYSERKNAGRVAAGLHLKGNSVAIARIGGSRIIMKSSVAIENGVEIETTARLVSVDRKTGAIMLTA